MIALYQYYIRVEEEKVWMVKSVADPKQQLGWEGYFRDNMITKPIRNLFEFFLKP